MCMINHCEDVLVIHQGPAISGLKDECMCEYVCMSLCVCVFACVCEREREKERERESNKGQILSGSPSVWKVKFNSVVN